MFNLKSNKFGFYRVDVEHASMIGIYKTILCYIFKLPEKKNEKQENPLVCIFGGTKGKFFATEKVVAKRIIAYMPT